MYAFSLEFFTSIYLKAIKTAEKPEKKNPKVRIMNIFKQVIKRLNTCNSVFQLSVVTTWAISEWCQPCIIGQEKLEHRM